jgi:hypothetical protein
MTYKFGADPEVFVTYKKDGKDFVLPPAYFREFLGIDYKPDPRHPKFLEQDGITIHEDGVAFEFTLPPAGSIPELLSSIHYGYDLLKNKVLVNFPEYEIKIVPTVNFEVERWLPYQNNESFYMTLLFGCDPHLLAWEPEKEDEPVDATTHPYRYGGGHEHFSGSEVFRNAPVMAIRILDLTVGLASVAFSPVPELEQIRTFRYGKAGVFRPQVYPNGETGIEYRSISNSWTNPENTSLAKQVEKWTNIAMEVLIPNLGKAEELVMKYREELLTAISTSNQALALEVLNSVEGEL